MKCKHVIHGINVIRESEVLLLSIQKSHSYSCTFPNHIHREDATYVIRAKRIRFRKGTFSNAISSQDVKRLGKVFFAMLFCKRKIYPINKNWLQLIPKKRKHMLFIKHISMLQYHPVLIITLVVKKPRLRSFNERKITPGVIYLNWHYSCNW